MQKFHRKKIAMYFGNFITEKDLDLVYWAIKQKDISIFYNTIKSNDDFDISLINKRAVLAIQLFFEYGYYPIFPEIFALANNSISKTKSLEGKIPFSALNNILDAPKRVYFGEDWELRFEDREFTSDTSDLFLRNTSVLEAFLAASSDLIVNFMETNSSAVETGIYLNKGNFKKTIIITPPQAQIERVAVGEFTNYIIKELKPKSVKSNLYQRVSLFMELTKYDASKDTSGFYTYLNPFEIPPLLVRYMKKRAADFSLDKKYKMVEKSDEFYNLVHDITNNPLDTLTNKAIKKDKLPSQINMWKIYSRYNSLIESLFSRNSEESIANKVLVLNRIASFFLLATKQEVHTKEEIEHYDIVKKNGQIRRIYPQPFSSKAAYKIASEMLYIWNENIVNEVSHGYVKGKGIYDGLAKHIGNNSYIKLDISNFFGSLKRQLVEKIVDGLNIDNKFLFKTGDGVKQGYIISPVVSNIYMIDFDNLALQHAKINNLVITRYADDILISGKNLTIAKMEETIIFIEDLLRPLGLNLNSAKTKKSRDSIHFLGLTINEKEIKISRRKRKILNRYKKIKSENLSARQWGIINYFKYIETKEKKRNAKLVKSIKQASGGNNENP